MGARFTVADGVTPKRTVEAEQFYTPRIVADWVFEICTQQVWWWQVTEAIEPSAGTGVFVDAAAERFGHYLHVHAFDTSPAHPLVQLQDALTVDVEKLLTHPVHGRLPRDNVLLVGNPPFGYKCDLAIKFLKHYLPYVGHAALIMPKALSLGDRCGFPSSFPSNIHTILATLDLPDERFTCPADSQGRETKLISGCSLFLTEHRGLVTT